MLPSIALAMKSHSMNMECTLKVPRASAKTKLSQVITTKIKDLGLGLFHVSAPDILPLKPSDFIAKTLTTLLNPANMYSVFPSLFNYWASSSISCSNYHNSLSSLLD